MYNNINLGVFQGILCDLFQSGEGWRAGLRMRTLWVVTLYTKKVIPLQISLKYDHEFRHTIEKKMQKVTYCYWNLIVDKLFTNRWADSIKAHATDMVCGNRYGWLLWVYLCHLIAASYKPTE